ASKGETQQASNVVVSVTSAKVERVLGAEKRLVVRLQIDNRGNRLIAYHGWGNGRQGTAQLTDDKDRLIGLITPRLPQRIDGQVALFEHVRQGPVVTDVLHFDPPKEAFDHLKLELPAQNLGGNGKLRFKLPKAWVTEEGGERK